MRKYKALLFAPDGDWITACNGESIDDVIEKITHLGSRWHFYPISHFIIRDNGRITRPTQRIILSCNPFKFLQGKTIRIASSVIQNNPELIGEILNP